MQAKSFFLAAALLASPAMAFAQSTADQPAPAPSPDAAPAPGPAASAPVPATAADLTPNAAVYDATGTPVGKIESVTSAGAVVFTGVARAQIPVGSFSKNAQGLVIGMSKIQLEAAVAKATPPKS